MEHSTMNTAPTSGGMRDSHALPFQFLEFLHSGQLTDFTILHDGNTYKVHKLLLAFHSQYFRGLFSSSFRENLEHRIDLSHLPDPFRVFPIIIASCYSGNITFDSNTLVPIFAMARFFQMERIEQLAASSLRTLSSPKSCIHMALQAYLLSEDQIQQKCIKNIAKYFYSLFNEDFSSWPVQLMMELVSHSCIYTISKEEISIAITNYIKSLSDTQVTPVSSPNTYVDTNAEVATGDHVEIQHETNGEETQPQGDDLSSSSMLPHTWKPKGAPFSHSICPSSSTRSSSPFIGYGHDCDMTIDRDCFLAMSSRIENISPQCSLFLLVQALKYNDTRLYDKCVQSICKNFSHMPIEDFHVLEPQVLHCILSNDGLAASSEYRVYQCVSLYIKHHHPPLLTDERLRMYEAVRFPSLTKHELHQVVLDNNSDLPHALLMASLLIRLDKFEDPNRPIRSNGGDLFMSLKWNMPPDSKYPPYRFINVNMRPRQHKFVFTLPFDTNGLFYYLGTNGYTEKYSNPAERGAVKVTCGDWLTPPYITCIVGRADDSYNHTRDALGTWFCVDIGENSFTPNYYCLKNSDDAKRPLRNWNLEGSNDGVRWSPLSSHRNDCSLETKKYSTAAWPLNDIQEGFRFFRVLQCGINACGDYYLELGGIELYGTLSL